MSTDLVRIPAHAASIAIAGQANGLAAAGLRHILLAELNFAEVLLAASFGEVEACLVSAPSANLLVLDYETAELVMRNEMRSLRASYPKLRVVIIADLFTREDILLALSSGVHGYVAARQPLPQIVAALREVAAGRISVASEVAQVAGPEHEKLRPKNEPKVSQRQKEVLRLLAAGNSNKEIARALGLSEGTVKAHIAAGYRILGVHNRTQAAVALAQFAVA